MINRKTVFLFFLIILLIPFKYYSGTFWQIHLNIYLAYSPQHICSKYTINALFYQFKIWLFLYKIRRKYVIMRLCVNIHTYMSVYLYTYIHAYVVCMFTRIYNNLHKKIYGKDSLYENKK